MDAVVNGLKGLTVIYEFCVYMNPGLNVNDILSFNIEEG